MHGEDFRMHPNGLDSRKIVAKAVPEMLARVFAQWSFNRYVLKLLCFHIEYRFLSTVAEAQPPHLHPIAAFRKLLKIWSGVSHNPPKQILEEEQQQDGGAEKLSCAHRTQGPIQYYIVHGFFFYLGTHVLVVPFEWVLGWEIDHAGHVWMLLSLTLPLHIWWVSDLSVHQAHLPCLWPPRYLCSRVNIES